MRSNEMISVKGNAVRIVDVEQFERSYHIDRIVMEEESSLNRILDLESASPPEDLRESVMYQLGAGGACLGKLTLDTYIYKYDGVWHDTPPDVKAILVQHLLSTGVADAVFDTWEELEAYLR